MSPAQRFILAYLGWVGLLFALFYLDTNPLSHWINETQREMLLDMLRATLGEERIRGIDILAHPKFRIFITQACNGLIPYYLYLAAVLAYPVVWSKRLLWALIGYGVISVVNLLRLIFVTAMVERAPSNFSWSHDLVGNLLLMATGMALFLLFVRFSEGREGAQRR